MLWVTRIRKVQLCAVVGIAAALVSGASLQAAEEESTAVKNAKQLIESQAKTILRAAHPLGKFKEAECDRTTKTGNGCDLTYTIRWTGKEKKEEKEFRTVLVFGFVFENDGAVDKVAIMVNEDSSSSKPFRGGKIAVSALKGVVKPKLKQLGLEGDPLYKSVDDMEVVDLLAVWLKYAERKKK